MDLPLSPTTPTSAVSIPSSPGSVYDPECLKLVEEIRVATAVVDSPNMRKLGLKPVMDTSVRLSTQPDPKIAEPGLLFTGEDFGSSLLEECPGGVAEGLSTSSHHFGCGNEMDVFNGIAPEQAGTQEQFYNSSPPRMQLVESRRRSRTKSAAQKTTRKIKGATIKNKPLYRPWFDEPPNPPPNLPLPAIPTEQNLDLTRKPLSWVHRQQLQNSIAHLQIPLVPLVSVTTGLPHPHFPRSILHYHLLTHDELDDLARWYHQTIDAGRERWSYPVAIEKAWTMSAASLTHGLRRVDDVASSINLATKRRRFGRFIGLKGCESPIFEAGEEQDETIAEKMEREWKAALEKAEDDRKVQEKIWRGHM